MSSSLPSGASSVSNSAELSPARREHERYLLDLTGLSEKKANDSSSNAVNFSMNFTGIPDERNDLPNDPVGIASARSRRTQNPIRIVFFILYFVAFRHFFSCLVSILFVSF